MGNSYYALQGKEFICPVCHKKLSVIVHGPKQELSDQTTGYNNGVLCSCGFKASIGYNGGWGAHKLVVCKPGVNYWDKSALQLDWHSSDRNLDDNEIAEFVQESLNKLA